MDGPSPAPGDDEPFGDPETDSALVMWAWCLAAGAGIAFSVVRVAGLHDAAAIAVWAFVTLATAAIGVRRWRG